MNWPSDSRNAISTPLSPLTFGSRGPSLFVPTNTIPLATTGFPYACEPSSAIHFTFFLVFRSQVVGSPFMLETMLRSGVPPHMGQSPDPGSENATRDNPASATPAVAAMIFFMFFFFRLEAEATREQGPHPGSRIPDPSPRIPDPSPPHPSPRIPDPGSRIPITYSSRT